MLVQYGYKRHRANHIMNNATELVTILIVYVDVVTGNDAEKIRNLNAILVKSLK